MSVIDLSKLPLPAIIPQTEIKDLLESIKQDFLKVVDKRNEDNKDAIKSGRIKPLEFTLEDSSPVTMMLEMAAMREYYITKQINSTGVGVLLPFAEGDALESLVTLFNVERKGPGDLRSLSDDELRKKAMSSIDKLSTAGSRAGYEIFAREALGDDLDGFNAYSPAVGSGVVNVVYLLKKDAQKRKDELEKKLIKYLSSDSVRPITDKVVAEECRVRNVFLSGTIHILDGADKKMVSAVSFRQLDDLIKEKRLIGTSIYRSAIMSALHAPNVEYVDLTITEGDRTIDQNIVIAQNELAEISYTEKSIKISGTTDATSHV